MEQEEHKETELKKREVLRMSNEESHKLTLDCIRTALIHLMAVKPYDKITITDIINRSGVSRAAFYRNFSSKDDVLQAAMRELTEQLEKAFTGAMAEKDPVKWMINTLHEVKNNRREMEMLIKANLNVEEIFINMNLQDEDTDPLWKYKNMAHMSALWSMTCMWIKNGFRESPEELGQYMISLFT